MADWQVNNQDRVKVPDRSRPRLRIFAAFDRQPNGLLALFIDQQGKLEAMTYDLKRGVLLFPFIASVLLSACVSQSKYDELQAQYQRVQQQKCDVVESGCRR